MKVVRFALAFASALSLSLSLFVPRVQAIALDDIPLWTGSGTNRAALVIQWNSPELFNNSSVAAPVANKTMVWGYHFNGPATATQMLQAVLAADPKLYVVADATYGTFIESIGYNLDGNGVIGVSDGTAANVFTNGFLTSATVDPDAAGPLNQSDLFWSGYFGPNWQVWTELGDAGGFAASPDRGNSRYWNTLTGIQGQWEYANDGLDELALTNGSWIGFSVAAAGYDGNPNDPAYAVYNNDEQAPPTPDGTYVAYAVNTNDFAMQVVSSSNLAASSPYNDPTAVLNAPTRQFFDPYDGDVTDRVSILDPPYNVTPEGGAVVTEITSGGQITVQLGRKVYDDPDNPYGVDLIVYGSSFFTGVSGTVGNISDSTDLNVATLTSSAIYGHATVVSVSQDGTNWYAFPATPDLFPDNAYRWDDANDAWTDEAMNPTKPLNPYLYTNAYAGQTVAGALDQFAGAAGGTGYSLKASGLPWIQYVQIQPGAGAYSLIDAIAAVNPAVVGDGLTIAPDNLAAGVTRLAFQNPADASQNQIAINFASLSGVARVVTISLNEFSAFAPVTGKVSSAYQIQTRPVAGTNTVTFQADLDLRAGNAYVGDGSDLRLYQWNCTNWTSLPFGYSATNHEVLVSGVTNFSAFVVSQIVPPSLSIQPLTNGFVFQFAPIPNGLNILERSTDLATWTPVATNTPGSAAPILLQDTNTPSGRAFYRLRLDIP
jgi:hypothetical protein